MPDEDHEEPIPPPPALPADIRRPVVAGGPDPFGARVQMSDVGTPITPSGPLAEDEPEGLIPPSPLWAMKLRRHFQWSHLLPHDERVDRIRECIGTGGEAVYVIDDGHHHCVIGRDIGSTPDGCRYSLVARIGREQHRQLAAGELAARDAFLGGSGRALYGVIEDGPASNVFIIGTFGRPEDIPEEYLPPNPPVTFTEDLEEF